jgi:hypothetical protein
LAIDFAIVREVRPMVDFATIRETTVPQLDTLTDDEAEAVLGLLRAPSADARGDAARRLLDGVANCDPLAQLGARHQPGTNRAPTWRTRLVHGSIVS